MRTPPTPPTALTIAGSDSGGSAGLQADLRTLFACGVHAVSAVTAVTVQNTRGVRDYSEIAPAKVAAQITTVTEDIGVGAAKTGMLASAGIIEAVCSGCDDAAIGQGRNIPLVVDPVAASMHGTPLLSDDALRMLCTELIPRSTLVTPNLDEVLLLTGIDVTGPESQRDAGKALLGLGAQWALVKGGHMRDTPECLDLLVGSGTELPLRGPRYDTRNTHGGGDTMASTITAALAQGHTMTNAVTAGTRFVQHSVAAAYPLGSGVGPVSPFWQLPETPFAESATEPPTEV